MDTVPNAAFEASFPADAELAYVAQSRLLTMQVNRILVGDGHVSNVRWAMNADPRDAIVADPNELNWAQRTP